MKLSILGLIISSTLCGCSILDEQFGYIEDYDNPQEQYETLPTSASETSTPFESSVMFQKQFKSKLANTNSTKNLNDMGYSFSKNEFGEYKKPISAAKLNINHYAKGLMQDLVSNLQYVNSTTPVAVVSFVMLDSDYNQSSLLGNQMAESLIHEIHKFGIPVIDYKTTGYIRITEQGDFAFTKDYEELPGELAARYIVGGTMAKHKDGYLVNARVVGLTSKAVVASAQSFIPNEIANALIARISEKVISGNEFVGNNEELNTNQTVSLIAN
jgi:TolB-like protein